MDKLVGRQVKRRDCGQNGALVGGYFRSTRVLWRQDLGILWQSPDEDGSRDAKVG